MLEPIRVTPLAQIVVTTPIEIQSSASDAPPITAAAREPAATTAAPSSGDLINPWATAPEPASTARETPSHEPARCADGQSAYFDARSQIYRPCPAPGPAPLARPEPRVSRGVAPRGSEQCPPGARSYFDERNQLYRPCPESADARAERARVGRSPARPRAAAASGSQRCAPGARSYYDEANQLYRPCP